MKGFSLIETLVAILVFLVLSSTVAALTISSYRSYYYLWDQIVAVSEARIGIREMVQEIREATIGGDGSYPIVKAADSEFIFFGDIDHDDEVERVRYFLGSSGSGSETSDCVSFSTGGECSTSFSSFLDGDLISAELIVSVEGDLGWSLEYADLYVDGFNLGRLCDSGCSDCAASWQGTSTFDITEYAEDGYVDVRVDSTGWVDGICDWEQDNHSIKAQFELSWTEDIDTGEGEFKKGTIDPVGSPVQYPSENENVKILSRYVRNVPPVFTYFDDDGSIITEYPARLKDTKVMQVFLRVDRYEELDPPYFDLISKVKLRNIDSIYEGL